MAHTHHNVSRSALYKYSPSGTAATLGAVITSAITVILLVRVIKTRSWVFAMMLFAALMNAFGLAARISSIDNPDNKKASVISYISIILAPSFAAAACYMVHKRLVFFTTPPPLLNKRTLWVPPYHITAIFVGFDISTFLVQLFGLVVLASSVSGNKSPQDAANAVKAGENIFKFGLIIQLLCFGIFTVIGVRFLCISKEWHAQTGTQWRPLSWSINTSTTIIMLRAIFRVVEFSGTSASDYVETHEWTYWVFDGYPMIFVFLLACFIHPGSFLPEEYLKLRFKGVKSDTETFPLNAM